MHADTTEMTISLQRLFGAQPILRMVVTISEWSQCRKRRHYSVSNLPHIIFNKGNPTKKAEILDLFHQSCQALPQIPTIVSRVLLLRTMTFTAAPELSYKGCRFIV